MTEVDVLILGAGAAGLMCAIEAGHRGRRTLVLEHADRPGKKVLISGGGRCNFTNLNARAENFLSANPHFVKSALARYTPQDFLALVQKHRIPWHEKTLGQLFCDRSAHDILNLLLTECAEANARIQLSTRILSITRADGRFRVETSGGPIAAASLVVATGGLSIPKMGATSLGYELAAQFGHPIVPTRPGLVPLVFNAQDQSDWCDLSGISAEVVASTAAPQSRKKAPQPRKNTPAPPAFREKMLLTHRGVSGPAVLQISSYWHPGEPISLDLAPTHPLPSADPSSLRILAPLLQRNARRDLAGVAQALRSIVPGRMADRWRALYARRHPADAQAHALSNATLVEIERQFHAWRIVPVGTEGYEKAEVTAGGVDTAALDARTMQSRLVPGLYFIGEVVDVTGWLGGYNFQWAWASGYSAGQSA
jgi:predicted Rossmann fold flavoprotein